MPNLPAILFQFAVSFGIWLVSCAAFAMWVQQQLEAAARRGERWWRNPEEFWDPITEFALSLGLAILAVNMAIALFRWWRFRRAKLAD